jgi:hypothetical protein
MKKNRVCYDFPSFFIKKTMDFVNRATQKNKEREIFLSTVGEMRLWSIQYNAKWMENWIKNELVYRCDILKRKKGAR